MARVRNHKQDGIANHIIKDDNQFCTDDISDLNLSNQNECKSSIQREISNLDTLREHQSTPNHTEIKRNLNLDLKNLSNNTI